MTILYYLQLFLLFLLGQLFIGSQIVQIVRIVRIVKIVKIVGRHQRRCLIIVVATPLVLPPVTVMAIDTGSRHRQ